MEGAELDQDPGCKHLVGLSVHGVKGQAHPLGALGRGKEEADGVKEGPGVARLLSLSAPYGKGSTQL